MKDSDSAIVLLRVLPLVRGNTNRTVTAADPTRQMLSSQQGSVDAADVTTTYTYDRRVTKDVYNGYLQIANFHCSPSPCPHRHDKDDYRLLLNPREDAYDAITIILGAIWHDILGRRDDLHVKGQWHKIQMFGGVW